LASIAIDSLLDALSFFEEELQKVSSPIPIST